MATLYERIDELCRKKGITGGKMCNDLGISRSTMTELRKGRTKTLKLEKASKIAKYFDVSEKAIRWALSYYTENCGMSFNEAS